MGENCVCACTHLAQLLVSRLSWCNFLVFRGKILVKERIFYLCFCFLVVPSQQFFTQQNCVQVPCLQTQSQLPGLCRAVCLTQAGLAVPLFSGPKESQGRVAVGLVRGPDGGRKDVLKAHGLVGVMGAVREGRARMLLDVTRAARWMDCTALVHSKLPMQSGPRLGGGNTSVDSAF